jgi:hypothetical protein
MSSFLGRNSRRRRVLNEEALSASSAHLALRGGTSDDDAEAAPRYSEAAGVEHHPQVTDFVPRRYRTIGALALVGAVATAAVEALYWFATPAVAKYGYDAAATFDLSSTGGVAAWMAAVLLLANSAMCLLIYSLRRHRINDFRGRYRAWLAAAAVCALLSVASVAPVYHLIAAAAAYHTGWTALRGHAAWWLVLGGLPLAWIALRAWLDSRESPLAAVALGLAGLAYGIGITSYLGIWPKVDPHSEVMVTAGATLLGHWLLLVGVVAYSRFVVLDAQGLIPVRKAKRVPAKVAKKSVVSDAKESASRPAAAAASPLRAFRQHLGESSRQAEDSESTKWIDGSEGESDGYDDDESSHGHQKLSKAERKRLRKLKAQGRAA